METLERRKYNKLKIELNDSRTDKILRFLNEHFYRDQLSKDESLPGSHFGFGDSDFFDCVENVLDQNSRSISLLVVSRGSLKKNYLIVQNSTVEVVAESESFLVHFLKNWSSLYAPLTARTDVRRNPRLGALAARNETESVGKVRPD